MKRTYISRIATVLLVLCLVAGAVIIPVSAKQTRVERPMTVIAPMTGYAAEDTVPTDGTLELIDGTAAEWIDRVRLPRQIRDLYDRLVEGADNDGIDDILIEDSYYQDPDYAIEVATETFSLNGQTAAEAVEALEARYMPYLYTVFGAFDRDHPEVFWLSNAWQTGSVYSVSGNTCTVTILVGIRQIRASAYPTAASIRTAIAERDAAVEEICRGFTWETTTYERIVHFNDVLTKSNQYNTSGNLNAIHHDCRECVSALAGRVGSMGPVCEGYARAFKVLCDASGIPCVLVDGIGKSTPSSSEGHMWNSVQVDGVWYGVDVTWNDPAASLATGAVSGYESHDWLLVGSESLINGRAYTESHLMRNQVYADFMGFTNGPEESKTAYNATLTMALNLPSEGYVYDGSEKCPQTVVKYNGATLSSATDYTVVYESNRGAGTATVWVMGKGAYSGMIVTTTFPIEQKALIPTLSAKHKMYDGTTAAVTSAALTDTDIVAGDTVRVEGGGFFASPDAAERVRILWNLTLTGAGSENYTLAIPDTVTAEIERRPVKIYATKTQIGVDDPIHLTYTVDPETPLVEGEQLTGVLNFDPNGKNGVYTITAGTLTDESNPNYHITFVSSTLTIGEVETEGVGTEAPLPTQPILETPAAVLAAWLSANAILAVAAIGAVALVISLIGIVAVFVRKRR